MHTKEALSAAFEKSILNLLRGKASGFGRAAINSHGLIGAGIGAGAGGVNAAMHQFSGDYDGMTPREKLNAYLGNMAGGGLAGGGIGALHGIGAGNRLKDTFAKAHLEKLRPQLKQIARGGNAAILDDVQSLMGTTHAKDVFKGRTDLAGQLEKHLAGDAGVGEALHKLHVPPPLPRAGRDMGAAAMGADAHVPKPTAATPHAPSMDRRGLEEYADKLDAQLQEATAYIRSNPQDMLAARQGARLAAEASRAAEAQRHFTAMERAVDAKDYAALHEAIARYAKVAPKLNIPAPKIPSVPTPVVHGPAPVPQSPAAATPPAPPTATPTPAQPVSTRFVGPTSLSTAARTADPTLPEALEAELRGALDMSGNVRKSNWRVMGDLLGDGTVDHSAPVTGAGIRAKLRSIPQQIATGPRADLEPSAAAMQLAATGGLTPTAAQSAIAGTI